MAEEEGDRRPEIGAHEEQHANECRSQEPVARRVLREEHGHPRRESEGREGGVAFVRVIGDDDALGGQERTREQTGRVPAEAPRERDYQEERAQAEGHVQQARDEEARARHYLGQPQDEEGEGHPVPREPVVEDAHLASHCVDPDQ
jgi:hypothetical protein